MYSFESLDGKVLWIEMKDSFLLMVQIFLGRKCVFLVVLVEGEFAFSASFNGLFQE